MITFNLISIILAAAGHFEYANKNIGGMILGNLLTAVMFRNELFLRVLYFLTITLLSRVRSFPLTVVRRSDA